MMKFIAALRESVVGPSRQAAFFGPTVANGALRTWLDLQLAPPSRDWTRCRHPAIRDTPCKKLSGDDCGRISLRTDQRI
jgi:hypothetical protein